MTSVKYLSIIDKLLDNYKYQTTEDGYTFSVTKKEGIYQFLLMNEQKALQQLFTKEQIKSVGLEYISREVENIFFRGGCSE